MVETASAEIIGFPDDQAYIRGEKIVRIPDGEYRIGFHTYYTRNVDCGGGRKPTLLVEFVILDNPYEGVILPRWYNVEEIEGKAREKGRFKTKNIRDKRVTYVAEYRQITGRNVEAIRGGAS